MLPKAPQKSGSGFAFCLNREEVKGPSWRMRHVEEPPSIGRPVTGREVLRPRGTIAALLAPMLLLCACGQGSGASGPGGKGAQGPTAVGYVVVQQTSVAIEQDLPARISAFQVSDVRPQVSGVIQRRLFTEGALVRQGQTLYQIDPRT